MWRKKPINEKEKDVPNNIAGEKKKGKRKKKTDARGKFLRDWEG